MRSSLVLYNIGRPLEAERTFRRVIGISSADGTDESVSPMLSNNLARTLRDLDRLSEARGYAERAYAASDRSLAITAASGQRLASVPLSARPHEPRAADGASRRGRGARRTSAGPESDCRRARRDLVGHRKCEPRAGPRAARPGKADRGASRVVVGGRALDANARCRSSLHPPRHQALLCVPSPPRRHRRYRRRRRRTWP